MESVTRRRLLHASAVAGLSSLAGCPADVLDSSGCDDPATVDARRATLSDSERQSVDPVQFDNCSAEVQEILRTAVREVQYETCLDDDQYIPEPLQRLQELVHEHGQDMHVYLRYDDAHYSLAISIEDMAIASHPERDE